jgi:C4-dicarboxylate transporter DctM subunit
MLPVIIFGGIFSGAFTANDAAVVACVYAFIVERLIHKSMKSSQVKQITINSAITSATLLIIVAGATCFGRLLTLESIPGRITEAVLSAITSPVVFLIAMNVPLLIVGMFMDIISATMILGPVFLPMLSAFDINWMHFGLIMTVNLAIGYCTPPKGGQSVYYRCDRQSRPDLCVQSGVALYCHSTAGPPGGDLFPDLVLYLPRQMGFNVGL